MKRIERDDVSVRQKIGTGADLRDQIVVACNRTQKTKMGIASPVIPIKRPVVFKNPIGAIDDLFDFIEQTISQRHDEVCGLKPPEGIRLFDDNRSPTVQIGKSKCLRSRHTSTDSTLSSSSCLPWTPSFA